MFRFFDILKGLCQREVDFIVVGGVAAILEGAPVSTFDVDVMHRQDDENHRRLLLALTDLEARYRDPAGRHLVPDLSKLESFRLHQLLTKFGPLDILTKIAPDRSYDTLIDQTVLHEIDGLQIRVLGLAAVIDSKAHAGRDKDRAVLHVLRRTLELKKTI